MCMLCVAACIQDLGLVVEDRISLEDLEIMLETNPSVLANMPNEEKQLLKGFTTSLIKACIEYKRLLEANQRVN